jgi:hypothetical protein
MRCLFRNAGALLAMVWSGAAAALAGPVNIRTTLEGLKPAAIVRTDRRAFGDVEPFTDLAARVDDARRQWFPEWAAPAPHVSAATAATTAAPAGQIRPQAIVIPLPSPVWLGLAGLGCAVFVARVLDPRLGACRALP